MRIFKLQIWHWGCPGVSGRRGVQHRLSQQHRGKCRLSGPDGFSQEVCKERPLELLARRSLPINLRCLPFLRNAQDKSIFQPRLFFFLAQRRLFWEVIKSYMDLGEQNISVEENCTFPQANLQNNNGNSHINHMTFENVLDKGTAKGLLMSWSIQERGSIVMAQELVRRWA